MNVIRDVCRGTTVSMSALSRTATSAAGESTRGALLRAAERLFAELGIGPTSTRAILREAGQRNESALHYHFGGREGLIDALYSERGAQVALERERMLRELDASGEEQDVRRLCAVAVLPPVRIVRRDPEFALFLKVVGQLAFLPSDALQERARRYTGASAHEVSARIRARLRIPEALADRRIELMHRMAALALSQRALSGGSFEGHDAGLFFYTLLDAMAAVLEGPVSPATERELANSRGGRK